MENMEMRPVGERLLPLSTTLNQQAVQTTAAVREMHEDFPVKCRSRLSGGKTEWSEIHGELQDGLCHGDGRTAYCFPGLRSSNAERPGVRAA